jgi:crossover junction endodeoxyribonuclease RuvC
VSWREVKCVSKRVSDVIRGLDARIHPSLKSVLSRWIGGSSPAMTGGISLPGAGRGIQPTMPLCGPPAGRYDGTIMARAIRILGIDPGLRRTGWGVIEADGNRLIYVACGSAQTDDTTSLAVRLVTLHDALVRVVDEFRPDEAAVEATFVNKDAAATLKLGQARGIAMVVPAKAGVMIAEYAPNLVKKAIVGAGHCDKAQIRMMLGVLLPKANPGSHDAADALAVAITHAHHRQSAALRVAVR